MHIKDVQSVSSTVGRKPSGHGNSVGGNYATLNAQTLDDELNGAADKVVAFLRKIPGSVNVQSSAETGAPRLNVQIDSSKAAILGVSPGAAATAARIAIDGACLLYTS